MYINIIDKNGNQETLFNFYTEEFKNKLFKKQNEFNQIGLLICEANKSFYEHCINDELYKKAVQLSY